MHDQSLAFIATDSYMLMIDGKVSYEILAEQFEGYWRATIAQEVAAQLIIIDDDGEKLPYPTRRRIIKSIWSHHE